MLTTKFPRNFSMNHRHRGRRPVVDKVRRVPIDADFEPVLRLMVDRGRRAGANAGFHGVCRGVAGRERLLDRFVKLAIVWHAVIVTPLPLAGSPEKLTGRVGTWSGAGILRNVGEE